MLAGTMHQVVYYLHLDGFVGEDQTEDKGQSYGTHGEHGDGVGTDVEDEIVVAAVLIRGVLVDDFIKGPYLSS